MEENLTDRIISDLLTSKGTYNIPRVLLSSLENLDATFILTYYVDKYRQFARSPQFDGWFYLTHEKILREFPFFSERTVIKTKQNFIEKGFIKVKTKGLPAKQWLQLDFQCIASFIYDGYSTEENEALYPSKMRGLYLSENRGLNNKTIKEEINKRLIKRTRKKSTNQFELEFIEPKFKDAFTRWLKYKKEEKGFKYKAENSALLAYNKLKEYSHNNPDLAMDIINRSIIAGYTGFFPLTNNTVPNKNNTPQKSSSKKLAPYKYKTPIKA